MYRLLTGILPRTILLEWCKVTIQTVGHRRR